MAKIEQIYNVGDFVYAKVVGYPYWPAKIKTKILVFPSFKYGVVFYGTLQTSICAENELKRYNEDSRNLLEKYDRMRKMRSELYKKSVEQIEKAMKEDQLSSVAVVADKPVESKNKIPSKKEDNQERGRRDELESNQENKRPKIHCRRRLTKQVSAAASAPVVKKKLPVRKNRNKIAIAARTISKANQNTVASSPGVSSRVDVAPTPKLNSIVGSSPRFASQANVPISCIVDFKHQDQQQESEKTRVLLTENVAASLDSLSMENPKLDDAIKHLKYIEKPLLEKVQISMLLRNPEVVTSMVQLSKYIGNVGEWHLNDLQLDMFNRKATEIREVSGKIVGRFMQLIPEYRYDPTGVPSRAVFQKQLNSSNQAM